MNPRFDHYDLAIRSTLEGWEARIGRPSCSAGCARCCRGTSVHATSGEVIQLLDGLEGLHPDAPALRDAWRQRARLLRSELSKDADRDPVNAVIDQGPCVFLNGSYCSIYSGRPDTCRAFYVWHDASFCGTSAYDMCVPAELLELRTQRFFERMRAECKEGRLPFFGHLSIMLDILDRLGDHYLRGQDLRGLVDPIWLDTGLVSFMQTANGNEIEAELAAAEEEMRKVHASEPWPQGYPRANEAVDRSELAAFPVVRL